MPNVALSSRTIYNFHDGIKKDWDENPSLFNLNTSNELVVNSNVSPVLARFDAIKLHLRDIKLLR